METCKLNLRLPTELHRQVAVLAEANSISMNALCVMAVRNYTDYLIRKKRSVLPQAPVSAVAPPRHRKRSRSVPKVGRNQRCPCGSGLKYKQCCYLQQ